MVLLLVGGLFGLGATVTAAVAPIYMPNSKRCFDPTFYDAG
jgi:hypothetical protein